MHQIATDSSQKIPQRWPPSVLGALRTGQSVERLAFAAAAWMRYLRGSDEQGQNYAIHDPLAEQLHALALAHADNPSATVHALGMLTAIWGEALPQNARWLARVSHWLDQITQRGILLALAQLNDAASPTSG